MNSSSYLCHKIILGQPPNLDPNGYQPYRSSGYLIFSVPTSGILRSDPRLNHDSFKGLGAPILEDD
ncbi:MAG TPA: hypothetical protein VGO47_12165 [Chlamydiales bacterium]|nr:hypothetical protein [Chlamydiales bacterium]